jgi:hypothetical protein
MGNIKKLLFLSFIILTQCGWIGYGNTGGWQAPILDTGYYSTTNQTLTSAQSGQIIISIATQNNIQFTLPTATVGLDFFVIAGTAKYMSVIPQSTDTIVFSSKTAGQNITNSGSAAIGDGLEIVCMQNNQWYIKVMKGTWA